MADIKVMTNSIGSAAAAGDELVATFSVRRLCRVLVPALTLWALVIVLKPVLDIHLAEPPAFIPVVVALVCCFNVLSAVLLVGQFRHSGEPRALALACAYVFSLVIMVGWAAAFPGVFGSPAPLGAVASTTPWLWAVWHTGFPVLLAGALLPWRPAWERPVGAGRRRVLAWTAVAAMMVASALVLAGVVVLARHLPVVIEGTDIRPLTRVAGPIMLPIIFLATVVTIVGSWRRSGLERWAGLAAAASLADVVLTLSAATRFSVGWYAGRTLTVVSAAVVLVALLGEVSRIRRRLAVEGDRLRTALDWTERLERLQHTLLGHMADGVVMRGRGGGLAASNPAAHRLLGLTADQLSGRAPADPGWQALRPDGSIMDTGDYPIVSTFRTAAGQRDAVVGVRTAEGGEVGWLSINTVPVADSSGSVEYVVCSMNDVTDRHAATLAAGQARRERRDCIQQVLDDGGPTMVFQPIIELATGKPVGAEALARFPAQPNRTPEEWFADAADVGLGVELELAAIRAAVAQLDALPAGTYLSLNAGPDTVVSPQLHQLLRSAPASRLVVELTEHIAVADYAALTEALDALRCRGVRLAVDDAGSGFSSLQHILNLKPDIIKLDRALVEAIDTDPARRALAGALLTFANEIGAQVIAEGIENLREQTVLRRLGVRYGQGFHLGRPGPIPLAEESLLHRPRLFAVNGG
jgi:PAS domain S-box-containing protein